MKMKTLAAAAVLGMITITGAQAIGLGVQANFSAGGIFAPGAALAISPSDTTHLAVNWFIKPGEENIIGLTLDLCPLDLTLTSFSSGSFNFTLGAGLYTNLLIITDEDPEFHGGLRIPVGLSLRLGRNAFEIYTHVAPSFGLHFLPSIGIAHPFFPVALGARLWFR